MSAYRQQQTGQDSYGQSQGMRAPAGLDQPPPPTGPPPTQQEASRQGGWGPQIQLQFHHWHPQAMFMPGGMPPQMMRPMHMPQPGFVMPQHVPYIPAQQPMQYVQHRQRNPYGSGSNGSVAAARPTLAPPPKRQKRRKDIVPAVEKMIENAKVRQPETAEERAEVEAWKAERRKNWPSAENLARKEADAAARRARGELEATAAEDRQRRLREVLQIQREMGVARQAGTEDLLRNFFGRGASAGRGQGRGGGRRAAGRSYFSAGRGGSSGGQRAPAVGWEAFHASTDPSVDVVHRGPRSNDPHGAPFANTEPVAGAGRGASVVVVESEGAETEKKATTTQDPLPQDLSSLVDYDSEGKESDAKPVVEPTSEVTKVADDLAVAQHGLHAAAFNGAVESSGRHDGRGRGGIYSNSRGDRGRGRHREDRARGRGLRHSVPPRPAAPSRPSLLEKLLEKEIRQDRSYVLQAFRFFVANNFLVDFAQGKPLEFPVPPQPIAEGQGDGGSAPTVEAILAAKEGVDVSDDEEDIDVNLPVVVEQVQVQQQDEVEEQASGGESSTSSDSDETSEEED